MPDALLELRAVETRLGRYHLLHGVDFAARRGRVTMLLGRNGAGKTTTLRTIMGLWRASAGSIAFDGTRIETLGTPDIALSDLREPAECARHGSIPGALHAPYPNLRENIQPGGILHELARGKRLLFYCAFGERSAMAVQAAQDAGLSTACHIHGGIAAWKKVEGPVSA